jgi:hypothetical protein
MATYGSIRYSGIEDAGIAGSGTTAYANTTDLPTSEVTTGAMAYVSANNKLYMWNGTAWFNIAIVNQAPTAITGNQASYFLATDGTPTVVTLVSTDPEGFPLTWSSSTSGDTQVGTLSQTENVFTITPSTDEADIGTLSVTFSVTDGTNTETSISSFILQFLLQNSQYTSALITSVGENNQVNNTFLDASDNLHTITPAGNVTQGTFSPYRAGGYSLYFNGTAGIDLGFSTLNSGNFTVESWVKTTVGGMILWKFPGSGSVLEGFGINKANGYMFTHTGTGVEAPTCVNDLRDGEWHYLVWERYNGTYYYWADGVLEASFANTEVPGAGGNWQFGGAGAELYIGYFKESRFSLNTAIYNGLAPPIPTEPQITPRETDAFFGAVGLELKDYSNNNRTLSVFTGVSSEPVAPYPYEKYELLSGGGSLYFDGSGDWITTPNTSAFDLSSSTTEFTIEGWVYRESSSYNGIVGARQNGVLSGWCLYIHTNGTFYTGSAIGANAYLDRQLDTTFIPLKTWTHFALVKTLTGYKVYINGVGGTEIALTGGFDYQSNQPLIVGALGSQGEYPFTGVISDLRIIKGTAVYTTNFTPPTAPLTAIANTSLLLSGTNAGIIDKSQSNKVLTLTGDVKSSTVQTKYSNTSISFDGTGDKIEIPNFELRRDGRDFTIEFWIYLNNLNAERNILETYSFSASAGWTIYHLSSGRLDFYPHHIQMATLSATTWTHVAIENYNGTIKCFINGTSTYSATHTNTSTPTAGLRIGTRSGTGNYLNGFMEDIRITDGYARYQGNNFTPPTAALTA